MRYYTVIYRHFKDGPSEWCRFSTREHAERCAEFLQQASIAVTGDLDRTFFTVLESMELSEWPDDCVGQLKIDAYVTFAGEGRCHYGAESNDGFGG